MSHAARRPPSCWERTAIGLVAVLSLAGCSQNPRTEPSAGTSPAENPVAAAEPVVEEKPGEQAAEVAAPGDQPAAPRPGVTLIRTPRQGLQPQAVSDETGNVHLIYFKGKPAAGDIFYVRQEAGAEAFSEPIRVNSHPGSAVAVGTIRGAQLAVGTGGRVHVAWNGSGEAQPRGPEGQTPMLYTRMTDSGTEFEPPRNVIQFAYGLDGGGSVAADGAGNVYVAWHAGAGEQGEKARRIWLARSGDEGKTFAREEPAWSQETGACGCCGMRCFAGANGALYMLYRSASSELDRDMFLLASQDKGQRFDGRMLDQWLVDTCPMSSAHFAQGPSGVVAAWERQGQVYFASVDPDDLTKLQPAGPPGIGNSRKHPVVAVNRRGELMLAWTEGTGWNRGGALAWRVFDRQGKPTDEKRRADGIATWSLAAVFVRPDDGFTIVY